MAQRGNGFRNGIIADGAGEGPYARGGAGRLRCDLSGIGIGVRGHGNLAPLNGVADFAAADFGALGRAGGGNFSHPAAPFVVRLGNRGLLCASAAGADIDGLALLLACGRNALGGIHLVVVICCGNGFCLGGGAAVLCAVIGFDAGCGAGGFLCDRSGVPLMLAVRAVLRHGGRHQTDHHGQRQQNGRQLFSEKSLHRFSLHKSSHLTGTNQ